MSGENQTTSTSTEVTGDPTTATYGSAPAAGQSTTAPTAAGPVVDYSSPRDVDGDGTVDVEHARIDGVDTTTYIDEAGHITLVEADIDGNGTYETAAAPQADGGVRIAEDINDDGDVDRATYYHADAADPYRQDEIQHGHITDTRLDTDGDGRPDVHLYDTNTDGQADVAMVDTDRDGIPNYELVDTDQNGKIDVAIVDTDNDGVLDTTVTATDAGDLGQISAYEALVPEDSHADLHQTDLH